MKNILKHLTNKKKMYILGGASMVGIVILITLLWRPTEEALVNNEIVQEVVTIVKDAVSSESVLFEYIQVTESCGASHEGTCVNVRSAPSTDAPVVFKARNGIVFKVSEKVTKDGQDWYKLSFDEWLRYPERVKGDLYISAEYVRDFKNEGNKELYATSSPTTKRILVDRSEQMLYAYENDVLFMEEKVSTGIELTPTPRGEFKVFRKTPSRYMQGPIPGISDHFYDLPGVPWNLYFTAEGAVIHGAYWHDNFGTPWSNGCVNLPIASAEKLYKWADVGTKITVRD